LMVFYICAHRPEDFPWKGLTISETNSSGKAA
jgi:hypothetical protein